MTKTYTPYGEEIDELVQRSADVRARLVRGSKLELEDAEILHDYELACAPHALFYRLILIRLIDLLRREREERYER